jgi:dienelactone hydrolase
VFAAAFFSQAVISPAVSEGGQHAAATSLQTTPATSSRQEWLIPGLAPGLEIKTTVLLPASGGPHPLAVINHGTTESAELRATYSEPSFDVVSAWLLARGYAVAIPQRPSHGDTAGPYLESAQGCEDARFEEAGYGTATSIRVASDFLLRQPFVKNQKVLLVGHSAGAWGALAFASQQTSGSPLVAGVINFSGGRGGHSYGVANRNCAPDRLVSAAMTYGRTTRAPTLWLYAQNDSYFPPALSRRMADAFRAAGGPVEYRLLPPIGEEGHALIYSSDAIRYWGPVAEKFLAQMR